MTDASSTVAQHRTNRKPLAAAMLAGLGLFFVACGVVSLCGAFSSGERLMGRLLMIALAAVSFFLPGWFALAALRLRWTTGRWTPSPEVRRVRLSRIATEKPLGMLRLVSSSAFTNVMDGILVVLAAMSVWLQVREGIHVFQLILLLVWLAVAASSLRRLLHRH